MLQTRDTPIDRAEAPALREGMTAVWLERGWRRRRLQQWRPPVAVSLAVGGRPAAGRGGQRCFIMTAFFSILRRNALVV